MLERNEAILAVAVSEQNRFPSRFMLRDLELDINTVPKSEFSTSK